MIAHFVGLAHRRQAVGQKDHVARPAGVGELRERDPQGLVDVRAPAGINPLGKAQGLAAGLVVIALQFRPERLDLAVEGDDVEQVALAEVVQHVLQGRADLLDLLPAHAAGAVHHQQDRLLRPLAAGLDLRAGQQEEVAVLIPVGPIRQHPHAHLAAADVVQQAEIGGGDLVLRRVADHGMAVVGPLDLDGCVGL